MNTRAAPRFLRAWYWIGTEPQNCIKWSVLDRTIYFSLDRSNTIQYNANSVITRLHCWLPFRWELHPATLSTAGLMRDQRYADHPHCVTRDGMQQQRGLLCTCRSSVHLCRKGREEWVMSNVARLLATGCDVNWSFATWFGWCVELVTDSSHTRAHWNVFTANLKQATLAHTHRSPPPSLYYDCQPHFSITLTSL